MDQNIYLFDKERQAQFLHLWQFILVSQIHQILIDVPILQSVRVQIFDHRFESFSRRISRFPNGFTRSDSLWSKQLLEDWRASSQNEAMAWNFLTIRWNQGYICVLKRRSNIIVHCLKREMMLFLLRCGDQRFLWSCSVWIWILSQYFWPRAPPKK